MSGNGTYDPSSVDAWNAYATRTIQLTNKLAVVVKMTDILSVIAADANNPLLGIISSMASGGQDATMLNDVERITAMTKELNKLLTDLIVSPPIREAGADNGISINQIPFEMKMVIFTELVGGDAQYERAERFLPGSGGDVAAGETG